MQAKLPFDNAWQPKVRWCGRAMGAGERQLWVWDELAQRGLSSGRNGKQSGSAASRAGFGVGFEQTGGSFGGHLAAASRLSGGDFCRGFACFSRSAGSLESFVGRKVGFRIARGVRDAHELEAVARHERAVEKEVDLKQTFTKCSFSASSWQPHRSARFSRFVFHRNRKARGFGIPQAQGGAPSEGLLHIM